MNKKNTQSKPYDKTTEGKRINLVSPWRNKAEFKQVHDWIYGEQSTPETKKLACKKLIVWKTRRQNLTPASVLGTLVILQIRVRDDGTIEDTQSLTDLRIIYSSAFTRFLNYMSSIMQTRDMKSMYETANDLGLNTFLVDLRHLCSHGQNLPSIDVFRKTSDYCLTWLKSFYWDNTLEAMMDVDATALRQKFRTEFDINISGLFSVFDAALEANYKKLRNITDIKKTISKEKKDILRKYSELKSENSIKSLQSIALNDLKLLVEKQLKIRDLQAIYTEAFFKMEFLFELGAITVKDSEVIKAIELSQELFEFIAKFGFIEEILNGLIEICENNYEPIIRRKGSRFWAMAILDGFNALQDFKILHKAHRDNHPKIKYPITSVISKNIIKIYEDLGIDMEKTLIFNSALDRPWHININKSYIEKRALSVNEFTVDILKKSLNLVDPPLPIKTINALQGLINSFSGQFTNSEDKSNDVEISDSKIYTLHGDVLKTGDIEMSEAGIKKFGIWSTVSDGEEWHRCPLGRLIWD